MEIVLVIFLVWLMFSVFGAMFKRAAREIGIGRILRRIKRNW